METADAVVIGAGHNGLVAASYLARAGLTVRILEARALIGGACVSEELIPGFKFSTCANAAWALDAKVLADLSPFEYGLVIDRLDPIRFHPFPDGTSLFAWQDDARTQAEIAGVSSADALAWPRWRQFLGHLGSLFAPLRYGPAPDIESFAASLPGSQDAALVRALAGQDVDEVVDDFFESPWMRAELAGYGPFLYSGGSALGIAWAAMFTGGSLAQGYPRGGMGAITKALGRSALAAGVTIETSTPVRQVLVERSRATGVETVDGRRIAAGIVISNADPKRTFLRLLDESRLEPHFRRSVEAIVTEPSCLKLHCAVSALPEYTAYDGPDPHLPSRASVKLMPAREEMRRAFADAAMGRVPDHPALSIMTPSLYDPSLAPPGFHTVSVYISPAPYRLAEGSWDAIRDVVAERMIALIGSYAPNFPASVKNYVLFTPLDLERRVFLTGGNIHHAEELPAQLFGRRPLPALADYRSPIGQLYLCGAGCHPGGEVTGLPGHNAAHIILEDLGRNGV